MQATCQCHLALETTTLYSVDWLRSSALCFLASGLRRGALQAADQALAETSAPTS